jgi:hypothetical protein
VIRLPPDPWPHLGSKAAVERFMEVAAHFFLAAPAIFKSNGICYGLRDALQFRVPGAILGALAVTWGRKVDWRGWLVAGLWMVEVGMLVA